MVALIISLSVLVVLLIGVLILVPMKVWFMALVSGAHISMSRLVGMKLRKVKMGEVVNSYVMARKAGLKIAVVDLETHYMAGGNVKAVISALISAHSAQIPITIQHARAIDLAGRDICDAINTSITPKVISTDWISAVAKDGIELKVKVKVTIKTDLEKLIGGAGEKTILARVGEAILTAVGQAETHIAVLEKPDIISRMALSNGLGLGTMYEIKTVEVEDIDIGKNIRAVLESEEAEKEKIVARALAEKRRAMAEALEQEMKAKVQDMKSALLSAEAEVPKSIATAIREGKFGIMDYYKLQNLNSDTAMRNSIAGEDPKKSGGGK